MSIGIDQSRSVAFPVNQPEATQGARRTRVWPAVARLQGTFYLVTGIWPLVAPASFQTLTGWKVDFWLAQTVGVLLAITGVVLVRAARRTEFPPELALLGGLQAAALCVIDLFCVYLPNTTWVYLIDAPIEFGFMVAWMWGWYRRR